MKKFELGMVLTTAGISEKISADRAFSDFVQRSFERYVNGDWGNLDQADKKSNDQALIDHERILAAYIQETTGIKIWIITEWDRSATTILFPEEY